MPAPLRFPAQPRHSLASEPMRHPLLLTAATSSAIAALLHLGCIIFGPPWYRFFGAGERMAQLAATGSPVPTLFAAGIAAVLALWAAYALSGAGVIARLPLLRVALASITGIYLTRGVIGLVLAAAAPGERSVAFWIWSSLICLAIGVLHLAGTWRAWPELSPGTP